MAKTSFILLIGVACALAAPPSELGWRIIGGSKADDGQFPYQISLRYENFHMCGGSIIDADTILCAAHCVDGASPSNLNVVVGTNKLNEGGTRYKVIRIAVHPQFGGTPGNDIAIIKVSGPIEFNSKVQPIPLEDGQTGGDADCVLSGWGSTYLGGGSPNDLQFINLKTYDIDECKKAHQSTNPVYNTDICTLTKRGEGACHGDSGGPLVSSVTGKQIGVVSWGLPCAQGKPDVFTRVESYLDWIEANK